MNTDPPSHARRSERRPTISSSACPACQTISHAPADRCPSCHFTGADSMTMFPGPPPPLLPVLDAGEIWQKSDLRTIEAARRKITRRFPQFKWRVCSTCLPPEINLRLFGFWMFNACPLTESETEDDRHWTVLLLINATTGKVAVVPGYAAEVWLSNDQWENALCNMNDSWLNASTGKAVAEFFKAATSLLDETWHRLYSKKSARSRS